MTIEYLICFLASIGLLIAYALMVKNKEFWLTMLFGCVPVVNLGYTLLAAANTVEFAVLANDIAYLGSVFLSMCMLLTIVRLCGFNIKRKHVIICLSLGVVMFAVIASSPMIPLYYKSVSLETVDGSAKLVKEYGVLHNAYLVYLVGYFTAMIVAIVHSVKVGKIGKPKFAGFIAGVVCGNIVVWLFEKFIDWNYEFLSVTYIISELLLLLVYWMMQDYIHVSKIPELLHESRRQAPVDIATMTVEEKIIKVLSFLNAGEILAARERQILEMVLQNKKRKEIADELCLSENTIKTYTRTLYGKLGVSSREELYALLIK
ncbi:MAG: hypothetical protein J6S71_02410 [Clostridia bacterium]|nr:hypothetical protein [Clostridia bacterium]